MCVVGVLYFDFVVCFTKTLSKYPQNVKYDKCIASLEVLYFNFFVLLDILTFFHVAKPHCA